MAQDQAVTLPKSGTFGSRAMEVLRDRPGLIFLLWAAWLSLEYVVLGRFSYVRIPDNADITLPGRLDFAHAFMAHNLGFWAPHWAAGVDRLSQLMGSSLDALAYTILPGWLAYGSFMLLQRFLASYFIFRLMRDDLELDQLPALYVALAFSLFSHDVFGGLSDNFTLYDGLALPGLPLVLWLLGRLQGKRARSALPWAVVIGVIFALTTGFPIAVFTFPLMIFWFALIVRRKSALVWTLLAFFFGGWLVASTPYLWATLANAGASHRAAWNTTNLGGNWISLLWLPLKIIRDNALALTLAVLGLVVTRGRERRLRALLAAIVMCFAFGPLHLLLLRSLRGHLGFLSGFTFDRFFLLVPFLAAVAGGLAISRLSPGWKVSSDVSVRRPIRLQDALASLAIGLMVFQSFLIKQENLWEMKEGSNFASIFQRPDLLELRAATRNDAPFRVVTAGDRPAYVWAYDLESADGYLVLYSRRYQGYWGEVIAPVLRENRWLHDYYYGYGNLISLLLPEFRLTPSKGLPAQSPISFDRDFNLSLLSLENVRFVISSVKLETNKLKLMPSRFRNSQPDISVASKFQSFVDMMRGTPPGPRIYIYENPQALPRFFLAVHAKTLPTSDEVFKEISAADLATLRSTVFLDRSQPMPPHVDEISGGDGEIKQLEYRADAISLEVIVSSRQILVLTNNYSRFWKAQVDGRAESILLVDGTFQGVFLSPGSHRVVLRYAPPYSFRKDLTK